MGVVEDARATASTELRKRTATRVEELQKKGKCDEVSSVKPQYSQYNVGLTLVVIFTFVTLHYIVSLLY